MNEALGALLWLVAATQFPATLDRQPPPDLEVVGRLKNLSYDPLDDPDDLLGHGWVTARLHITRVLRGRLASRLITVRYLAHTYRTETSAVRLRLRAGADGTYTVCAEPSDNGLRCG